MVRIKEEWEIVVPVVFDYKTRFEAAECFPTVQFRTSGKVVFSDHSWNTVAMRLLGRLSKVILAALLSQWIPGPAQAADHGKLLTWEHVYGRTRIVVSDPAPRDFEWLNDSALVQFDDSWKVTDAVTGNTSPLYDTARLHQQLKMAGVSTRDANDIVEGNWNVHNVRTRVAVLRSGPRLIRAGLDGDRISIVDGLPESIELLTLSPTGNACAFVAANELWCADFDAKRLRQLTHDAGPHVRNGKADWIYYEEVMRRKRKAFEFSPDGHHLVFQQFDDSEVATFAVVDHSGPRQAIEQDHYPQAGEQNPRVRLGIVSIGGGSVSWVSSPYEDASTLITGFGWYPDSDGIYWYAQNRSQTWLEFVRTERELNRSLVLLRETTGAWVDSPDKPRFLSDGGFLLLSEQSGWRHVARFSADGKTRRRVTSGTWDVNSIEAVNEDAGWIIVAGTRDSPIADQVYRVSLGDGSVSRLSGEAGHHVAVVSPSGTLMADRWSTHETRSSVVIRDSTGRVRRTVHGAIPPEELTEFALGDISIREVPLADGESANALFVYPAEFDAGGRHPVWLKVYGGPRYPRVRDSWNARLSDHLLASLGVVVVRFDPQTAGGHGAAGAWKAWRQLGVQEARDVEAVCNWLRKQSWVDGSRIGMSGHSYGGYLTSYVMTHSDCIAAGVAGAPVTDWANYDTIYTERYMGTPQDNSEGYKKSSVVAAASKLHGRLLIVHGLRDDNVHIANTYQLVEALQRSKKQFELMVYPKARHAIHHPHFNRLQHDFVVQAFGLDRDR